MKKKRKYYYVWNGWKTGRFDTWPECKEVTDGFPNAEFLAFTSLSELEMASKMTYVDYWKHKNGIEA